jgi:hypothetical protein
MTPRPRAGDDGSATVEFALVIPAIVMLLAAVLGVGQWAAARATAQTAAATGARVAIVAGDGDARAAVLRIAGPNTHVSIHRDDPWITVRVESTAAWHLPVVAEAVARGDG